MKNTLYTLILVILPGIISANSLYKKGIVFLDKNQNGVLEEGEKGIQGILVSNGVDIVKTDKEGKFALEKIGHLPIFIIKPSGYQASTVQHGQPNFYENALNSSRGELHFGLFQQEEKLQTRIVLLGDTQPHNVDEVYYILRTSTEELKKESYDFSLTLGDVVSDNPVIFPLVKEVIGASGRPSYFTFGNHDLNWEFPHEGGVEDWDLDFINSLGPTYYALSWGNINLISVNNISLRWNEKKDKYSYGHTIDDHQMTFMRNFLSHIDKDQLLIVSQHESPRGVENQEEFYNLFKGFTKVLFVFGHHHRTENFLIDKEQGWPNETPAHCIDAGAVCGGHWRGEEDIFGIPSAIMVDGSPKGYVFLDIDKDSYQLTYKASGMPAEKQMHIYSPDHLTFDSNFEPQDPTPENSFYANIYLGGDQTKVEYRIDGGKWQAMDKSREPDPYLKRIMKRQKLGIYPTEGARKLKKSFDTMFLCDHLWKASFPAGLSYGVHELEVRFSDPFIKDATEKHGFMYLSPEIKKANQKLDKLYKSWVSTQ